MYNFLLSSQEDLKNFLKDKRYKKIFIICGKKSYVKSGAKNLLAKHLVNKITKFYYKSSPYPDIVELKNIIFSLRNFFPDLIIAVGGGSVIDYAKIARAVEDESNLNKKIINYSCSIKKRLVELVAIPTTAGSGSEVTSNAVIYIKKIKYSVENEKLKPDHFFLIPKLIINASKKIKSSSGFDAIAQAVESLISKKSNIQSINFAKKSLSISLKYYLEYLKNPSFQNTSAMCIAANLSGKAISISKTTAPHAVSYPFTSFYNISHGHAVSLTLEKFLKFNFINYKKANCNFEIVKRYKSIFRIFGVKDILELEKYLMNIKKEANLQSDFEKLKINMHRNIDRIVDNVNLLRLKNNPINLNKKDIKDILLQRNFDL